MYLVLLGPPGAGKGTQAAIVAKELNLAHIATGDLFRQAVEAGTQLGLLAKSYMDKGELVPDEVTIQLIQKYIATPKCILGCVFDGFPRTLVQAEVLDKVLANEGKFVSKAIYIEVCQAEILRRLGGRWLCRHCQTPYQLSISSPQVPRKCDNCGGELYQRPDDKEETVKERLKVYFTQTAPVIEYYRKARKLVVVEGKGGVQEVARRILSSLRN